MARSMLKGSLVAIVTPMLEDGRIDADKAGWLRQTVFLDGLLKDEGRKLLHELKGEAKEVSRDFEALYVECMKRPMESHTCG